MSKQKLVLVGNGMAGVRTLEELIKLAPNAYDITVLGAEPHPNYNRIQLSLVLAGEQCLEDTVLHPLSWYESHGITLRRNTRAIRVDRERQWVETQDGATVPYDRLLLATGSVPIRLPVPGSHLGGVVTYRDMADTQHMLDAAASGGRAVVIGGGVLGLEAANGLMLRGMDVTVVHLAPWLMERQLDRRAAQLLQDALMQRGLKFRLGASTEALLPDAGADGCPQVAGVRLNGGEVLPANLVVMAVGIRPNTVLAEHMELECQRGVVVTDTLQSVSDPHIYAVGECASHRGVCHGLVAPLYEQAKVAAEHLAGIAHARYTGSQVSTKLKVTGVDVFSAGDFLGDEDCEHILLSNPFEGSYRRLVLRDDRLVGACLYGDVTDGHRFLEMIQSARNVGDLRDHLAFGVRPSARMKADFHGTAALQQAVCAP